MRNIVISLIFCFSLTGCGGLIDDYFMETPTDTVQEKFEVAAESMQSNEYGKAALLFTEIKDNYPFSPYVIESELGLADALYLNEEYLDAADAYRDFENLHPRHEAIPYVLLQVARSLRLSYRSIDRASTNVQVAEEYASRVLNEYPDTEYAEIAEKELKTCRNLLAEREVFISNVYWNMGNYEAAYNRYLRIMEQFPDVEHVYDYAQKQAEASYIRFRKEESEEMREKKEGTWKSWFKSWL